MKKRFASFLTEASNAERALKYKEAVGKRIKQESGRYHVGAFENETLIRVVQELDKWFEYEEEFIPKVLDEIYPKLLKGISEVVGDKYLLWVIKMYASGSISRLEDVESRAATALQEYQGFINKNALFKEPDQKIDLPDGSAINPKNWKSIDSFKSFADFEHFIRLAIIGTTKVVKEIDQIKKHAKSGGIEVLHMEGEANRYVIRLKSFESSKDLFKDRTNWCTSRSQNLYDSYSSQHPLLVMKYGEGRYWQCSENYVKLDRSELLDQDDATDGLFDWNDIRDTPVGKAFIDALVYPGVIIFKFLDMGEAGRDALVLSTKEAEILYANSSRFFLNHKVAWKDEYFQYVPLGLFYGTIAERTLFQKLRRHFNYQNSEVEVVDYMIGGLLKWNPQFFHHLTAPVATFTAALIRMMDDYESTADFAEKIIPIIKKYDKQIGDYKERIEEIFDEVEPNRDVKILNNIVNEYGGLLGGILAKDGHFGEEVRDMAERLLESSKKGPFSKFLIEASNAERAEKYKDAVLKIVGKTSVADIEDWFGLDELELGMDFPYYKEVAEKNWKVFLERLNDEVGEKYLLWTIRMLASNGIRYLEDVNSRAKPALEAFQKYSNKNYLTKAQPPLFLQGGDNYKLFFGDTVVTPQNWKAIDTYKSLPDLEDLIRLMEEHESRHKPKETEQQKLKRHAQEGGIQLLYQKGDQFVLRIRTFKASRDLFEHTTSWCTARSAGLYDMYTKEYSLVVMKWAPGRYWQCAERYMVSERPKIDLLDERDTSQSLHEWKNIQNTEVGKAFAKALYNPEVVILDKLSAWMPEDSLEIRPEAMPLVSTLDSFFMCRIPVAWNNEMYRYISQDVFAIQSNAGVVMYDKIANYERETHIELANILIERLIEYKSPIMRQEANIRKIVRFLNDAGGLKYSEIATLIAEKDSRIPNYELRKAEMIKPRDPINTLNVLGSRFYGRENAAILAQRGYFGPEIQKVAKDITILESTKPRLSDMITERTDQATTLLLKLSRGLIKSKTELSAVLSNLGYSLGYGGFSEAFYGKDGGSWVIKMTHDTQSTDSSYRLLGRIFEHKAWKNNSLFPRIMGVGELPDGNKWAIIEKLTPLTARQWYKAAGLVAPIGPADVFEEFLNAAAQRREMIPSNRTLIENFCDAYHITTDQLFEFLEYAVHTPGFMVLDIQPSNMGIREDGSICIFDPII